MAKCTNCGKDSTEKAGMYKVKVACTYPGCNKGYSECQGCTRYNGTILKCCGRCDPLGKRKCERCDGKGTKEVNQVCSAAHREATPQGGRPGSSGSGTRRR